MTTFLIIILFAAWAFFRGTESHCTPDLKSFLVNILSSAIATVGVAPLAWNSFIILAFFMWGLWLFYDIGYNHAFYKDWRHIGDKRIDKIILRFSKWLNADSPSNIMIIAKMLTFFGLFVLLYESM